MSSTDPLFPGPDSGKPLAEPGNALPEEPTEAIRPIPPFADWQGQGPADEGLPEVLPAAPDEALPVPRRPDRPPDPFLQTAYWVLGIGRLPHPNWFSAVLWCGMFLVVLWTVLFGVLLVTLLGAAALSGNAQAYFRGLTQGGHPTEQLALLAAPACVASEVVSVVFAWLVVRLVVGRDWKRRLAVRPPNPAHVVFALLSLPCMMFLASLIDVLARRYLHLPSIGDPQESVDMFAKWPLWVSILAIGVGPGIGEELWCRGFLGRGLVGRYGAVGGVLLTSLLFGALHLDPPYIVATAAMGLWLHYVYLTSRSLPLSMTVHFLNNTLAMVQAKYFAEGGGDGGLDGPTLVVCAGAAVLLAALAWALYQSRARLVDTGVEGAPPWRPAYLGVETPPPGSGTRVARPWPSWLAWAVVVLGVAVFTGLYYVASLQGTPAP
jgi:membrane protease YdiL (CAAX protease family)